MAPLLFLSFFLLLSVASSTLPPLPPPPDPTLFHVGFYNTSCPQAESAIRSVMQKHFAKNPSVIAGLLRILFHDCIVGGCEASLLIQTTKEPMLPSELLDARNGGLRGLDIIDEAKAAVEAVCPSTVSCADIVALTARDAVALSGGLDYPMPTGRRDSLEPQDVMLPFPQDAVSVVVRRFARKGLTPEDLVVLLGAHTIGQIHCNFVRDRLFRFSLDFSPSNASDPNIDPGLKAHLLKYCGADGVFLDPDKDQVLNLDQQTPFRFDNTFYKQLLHVKGIIQLDQALTLDEFSASVVATLAADEALFLQKFADALVKLASLEVLVGQDGEIRKNCTVPNKLAS